MIHILCLTCSAQHYLPRMPDRSYYVNRVPFAVEDFEASRIHIVDRIIGPIRCAVAALSKTSSVANIAQSRSELLRPSSIIIRKKPHCNLGTLRVLSLAFKCGLETIKLHADALSLAN